MPNGETHDGGKTEPEQNRGDQIRCGTEEVEPAAGGERTGWADQVLHLVIRSKGAAERHPGRQVMGSVREERKHVKDRHPSAEKSARVTAAACFQIVVASSAGDGRIGFSVSFR